MATENPAGVTQLCALFPRSCGLWVLIFLLALVWGQLYLLSGQQTAQYERLCKALPGGSSRALQRAAAGYKRGYGWPLPRPSLNVCGLQEPCCVCCGIIRTATGKYGPEHPAPPTGHHHEVRLLFWALCWRAGWLLCVCWRIASMAVTMLAVGM